MSSKFTSVTGSWCNALLDALERTTGCDSGLRDVSQFPGRCVGASPGGGLHLPVWDPGTLAPLQTEGVPPEASPRPPSDGRDIGFPAPGAGRFSAAKEAFPGKSPRFSEAFFFPSALCRKRATQQHHKPGGQSPRGSAQGADAGLARCYQ